MQTNIESQIAAMVYLDLILRSVTDPGLLKIMIKFLLDDEKFDGERILDILIDRINSHDSRVRDDFFKKNFFVLIYMIYHFYFP